MENDDDEYCSSLQSGLSRRHRSRSRSRSRSKDRESRRLRREKDGHRDRHEEYESDEPAYTNNLRQPKPDWWCNQCKWSNFGWRRNCHRCGKSRADVDPTFSGDFVSEPPAFVPSGPTVGDILAGDDGEDFIGPTPCNTFVLRGLDALTNEERITNNLDAVATGLGLSGATADVPSANAFARRCRVMRDELTKVSLCYALVEVSSATDAMTFVTRLRASDQRSSSEKAASQSGGKSDRSSRHSHRHRDSPDRRPLLEPLAELEIDGKMVSVNYAKNTFATITQQLQDLAKARAEFEQQYRERERDRPRRPPQRERDTASDAPFSMLQQSSGPPPHAARRTLSPLALRTDAAARAGTSYQYDPATGYLYDSSTGLYFDPNTKYYYSPQTQQWMSYDSNTKSWSVVSGASASTPAATAAQTSDSNAAQAATAAAGTSAGATAAGTTAATTTTTSTAAPPTAAEKKLEKVNLAKKIQKDMERWAKQQNDLKAAAAANKKKGTFRPIIATRASETPSTTGPTTDSSFAEPSSSLQSEKASGIADAAFDAFQSAVLRTPTSRPLTAYSSSVEEEEDPQNRGLVNWTQKICMLCQRQFQDRETLQKHISLSDLHKKNLEARQRGEKPSASVAPPEAPASRSSASGSSKASAEAETTGRSHPSRGRSKRSSRSRSRTPPRSHSERKRDDSESRSSRHSRRSPSPAAPSRSPAAAPAAAGASSFVTYPTMAPPPPPATSYMSMGAAPAPYPSAYDPYAPSAPDASHMMQHQQYPMGLPPGAYAAQTMQFANQQPPPSWPYSQPPGSGMGRVPSLLSLPTQPPGGFVDPSRMWQQQQQPPPPQQWF